VRLPVDAVEQTFFIDTNESFLHDWVKNCQCCLHTPIFRARWAGANTLQYYIWNPHHLTKIGIYMYILRYTQLYAFRGTCTMLRCNSALNGISRYIPVYTFTETYVQVCTFLYNLKKVNTCMYLIGYVRTIHGTYEYMQVHGSIGFRTFIHNAFKHGTSLFIQI
jgi:hypothetical protein